MGVANEFWFRCAMGVVAAALLCVGVPLFVVGVNNETCRPNVELPTQRWVCSPMETCVCYCLLYNKNGTNPIATKCFHLQKDMENPKTVVGGTLMLASTVPMFVAIALFVRNDDDPSDF
eukprot:m51a1_g2249 hypothetical protein (119) ;mRNA; r:295906-296495